MSPETPLRPGVFIAVVGPSGVGKDSLIACARQHFAGRADILFCRRTITRTADAGAEDHDTMSEVEFARAEANGAFCASWRAHGLRYGLPSAAAVHVETGGVAIANCSRAALDAIRARFPLMLVVSVVASSEVLAARLAGRGRETEAEIRERLSRQIDDWPGAAEAVRIDNSGPLDDACSAFIALVEARAFDATSRVSALSAGR